MSAVQTSLESELDMADCSCLSCFTSSFKRTLPRLCVNLIQKSGGVIDDANAADPSTAVTSEQSTPTSRCIARDGADVAGPSNSPKQSTLTPRVQTKSSELRKTFGLPSAENMVDDFICALRKKILLQGRMYVFEHHVCFYSNIFGYVKTKVIPFKDVTSVRKRKNYGFPNSVEIIWRGRKREFFTSFLSREDAYNLLMYVWHQTSPYAKLFHGGWESERIPKAISRATSLVEGEPNDTDRSGNTCRFARLRKLSKSFDTKELADQDDNGSHGFPAGNAVLQVSSSMQPTVLAKNSPAEQSSVRSLGCGSRDGSRDEDGSEDEEDTDQSGEDDSIAVSSDPVPDIAQDFTPLLGASLTVNVRDFIQRFLSNECRFFAKFYEAQGDRDVSLSSWKRHYVMGSVRELHFVANLRGKSALGPAEALCHQTQRYCLYSGDHLVFETQQVMPEIPYGDHFSVETRWDVTPNLQGPGCLVSINVRIPFTKQILLKRAIERSVIDQCRSTMALFLQHVKDSLVNHSRTGSMSSEVGGSFDGQGEEEEEQVDLHQLLRSLPEHYRPEFERMLKIHITSNSDSPKSKASLTASALLTRSRLRLRLSFNPEVLRTYGTRAHSLLSDSIAFVQRNASLLLLLCMLGLLMAHWMTLARMHTVQFETLKMLSRLDREWNDIVSRLVEQGLQKGP